MKALNETLNFQMAGKSMILLYEAQKCGERDQQPLAGPSTRGQLVRNREQRLDETVHERRALHLSSNNCSERKKATARRSC
jgi:hypothetical protein